MEQSRSATIAVVALQAIMNAPMILCPSDAGPIKPPEPVSVWPGMSETNLSSFPEGGGVGLGASLRQKQMTRPNTTPPLSRPNEIQQIQFSYLSLSPYHLHSMLVSRTMFVPRLVSICARSALAIVMGYHLAQSYWTRSILLMITGPATW
jgi:hypothetical protein